MRIDADNQPGPAAGVSSIREPMPRPELSIAILTWGDHLHLVRRSLESVLACAPAARTEYIVAANAPSAPVKEWLESMLRSGRIHQLITADTNLYKCPMMRHVIRAARGDHLWWFDDDSHVTDPEACRRWWDQIQDSSPAVVAWGLTAVCPFLEPFPNPAEAMEWVRRAPWFRGLPVPGLPDGPDAWWFLTGGCWWARLSALKAIDWPDPRLVQMADDVLLGEAIRQQGWQIDCIANLGVAISDSPRRGDVSGSAPRMEPEPA